MSQKRTYHIACPKCRAEQDVELVESINVRESPELKDSLLANRLNTVTCEACGYGFRVDKPLLYNDPDRRALIHLIPAGPADIENAIRRFNMALAPARAMLPADVEAPPVHLVVSRVELVERIFLLEAGLNERLIEYVKYMVYGHNAARIDPSTKILLFDAQDSTDDQLCFVVQDAATRKLESLFHFACADYEALRELFDRDEKTATLLELFPGPYISARILLLESASEEPGSPSPEA